MLERYEIQYYTYTPTGEQFPVCPVEGCGDAQVSLKGLERHFVLMHTDKDTAQALRAEETAQRAVAQNPDPLAKQTITVLAEKNPKRMNTASYNRFALYRDGMTVAEYLEAGGRKSDIRWDTERAFIAIQA